MMIHYGSSTQHTGIKPDIQSCNQTLELSKQELTNMESSLGRMRSEVRRCERESKELKEKNKLLDGHICTLLKALISGKLVSSDECCQSNVYHFNCGDNVEENHCEFNDFGEFIRKCIKIDSKF